MFRLLYFELFNHHILSDLRIDMISEHCLRNNDDVLTSVFIGKNGSGKSELLNSISTVFRSINNFKNKKTDKIEIPYKFKLVYIIDDNVFEVSSSKMQLYGKRKTNPSISFYLYKKTNSTITVESEKDSIKISALILPNKVLVSSIMLTDKFNSKSTGFYRYLGVRNEGSPQVAGTRAYIRRTVDFIIKGVKNQSFSTDLKSLLLFLGLQEKLYISYIPRYRNIFLKGDLTIDGFKNSFIEWEKVFNKRNEKPWGYNHFMKIKDDSNLINKIVTFLNKLSTQLKTYGSRGKYFSYDIIGNSEISDDFEMIQQLDWLNLIAYPSISVKRINGEFDYNIENSSSGETHFVTTMIGLLATIEQNSLILIDEPEISLHPNWQISYINQMKKTFSRFVSCHFLIATHSHFMISDLEPKSSNLIALTRNEDNVLFAELIESDTFGWSVDEILYKVFKVRSTRNIFFEEKLRDLAYVLTYEPENKDKIRDIVQHIKPYKISVDDPLNKIITLAEKLI